MIIYCTDNTDRINKMNYLLERMRNGYKWGIVSISQRKVKGFYKNKKECEAFLDFKGAYDIFKIIKLTELKFRLEKDRGVTS